jgi:hypothetical protein
VIFHGNSVFPRNGVASGVIQCRATILRASFLLGDRTTTCQGKEWVSFWNHDAEMSKSNDNRVEARECIRKANRCDDSQNRWAWLVLAKSWLLLADRQEIAESGFEASGQKLTADPRAAR